MRQFSASSLKQAEYVPMRFRAIWPHPLIYQNSRASLSIYTHGMTWGRSFLMGWVSIASKISEKQDTGRVHNC